MFVNTLLGKCTVSVKTQVRSDQWCPGKTREWGQGGAWVKYWKRMDKPGGGEARRALLVKWSVHRLRGMTQGGIWTLHCASDSTWLKNKERRCWELQSEKQKRQKKQRLCHRLYPRHQGVNKGEPETLQVFANSSEDWFGLLEGCESGSWWDELDHCQREKKAGEHLKWGIHIIPYHSAVTALPVRPWASFFTSLKFPSDKLPALSLPWLLD